MAEQKIDVEQLLLEGKSVQLQPQGYSMYPMFVPGRDWAVIEPVQKKLCRGDVVLYRREGGILVLHRIYKVKPEGVYLVGDNQTEIEGPLEETWIRGMLTSFIRKGRPVSVKNPVYRLASTLWLLVRPFRHKMAVVVHFLKKH